MAARIRPMPGQLWRPTREGSRAAPRLVVQRPDNGHIRFTNDVWFKIVTSGPYRISGAGWLAWVRMHAAVGEIHTGDP